MYLNVQVNPYVRSRLICMFLYIESDHWCVVYLSNFSISSGQTISFSGNCARVYGIFNVSHIFICRLPYAPFSITITCKQNFSRSLYKQPFAMQDAYESEWLLPFHWVVQSSWWLPRWRTFPNPGSVHWCTQHCWHLRERWTLSVVNRRSVILHVLLLWSFSQSWSVTCA